MDPNWVDVFPIKHGDIPASYVIVYQSVSKTAIQILILSCLAMSSFKALQQQDRNLYSYFGALEWALDVSNGFIPS